MSLKTATLAELARKRAGIGPVRTEQTGSPYSGAGTAPSANGDGVDTSSAVLVNVIITTTGGPSTWTLRGRSEGQVNTFDEMDGFVDVVTPADVRRKYRVYCETEDELHVEVASGTTTKVEIEPCNG